MFGIASASKVSLAMNVSGGAVRPVLSETRPSRRIAGDEPSNYLFSSAKGRMTGSRIIVTAFVTAVTPISEHGPYIMATGGAGSSGLPALPRGNPIITQAKNARTPSPIR
jgi:hypothetical protein